MSEQHNTIPSDGQQPQQGVQPGEQQQTQQPQTPAEGQQPEQGQQDQPLVIRGVEIPADLTKVEDPDMRAYYEALKQSDQEAKAKAAGEGGEQPSEQQQGQQPPAQQQPGQQQPNQPGTEPMIPKARFDDAVGRAREEAAYWRGVAESARASGQNGGTPNGQSADQGNQQQPTAEQQLIAIDDQIVALAEKFDNGEITMKEYKAEERKLVSQADVLRENLLLGKVQQHIPAPQEDLLLSQRTTEIEQQHPFLPLVFPNKPDAQLTSLERSRQDMIREEATQAVLAKHPNLQPGPQADLIFREALGQVADRYGAVWFPQHKPAAPQGGQQPQTPASPQTQQTGGKPALTQTQQQRLDKLRLADQQPPNTANLGTQGTGAAEYTPERIAQMSEDEYARLPSAVRARLRGE